MRNGCLGHEIEPLLGSCASDGVSSEPRTYVGKLLIQDLQAFACFDIPERSPDSYQMASPTSIHQGTCLGLGVAVVPDYLPRGVNTTDRDGCAHLSL
jgi:hypothetical protein